MVRKDKHPLERVQIIGHHPPGRTRTDNPAQAIEDFAQAMFSLRGFFGHQGQVRGNKGPSSSLTSLGYAFRSMPGVYHFQANVHNTL